MAGCSSAGNKVPRKMSGPKLSESQVMAELKNLQREMMTLHQSLQEFSNDVCSEKIVKTEKDNVIVNGAFINIGTTVNFRVPKMYQVKSLFGPLKSLAISRHLFSPKDIKDIEQKLKRKLDKYDTFYISRPDENGPQRLLLIRVVRFCDIAINKL